MTSAAQAVTAANRDLPAKRTAAAFLGGMIVLMGIGSPLGRGFIASATRPGRLKRSCTLMWTAAMTPWRLAAEPRDVRSSVLVTSIALLVAALLVWLLISFTTIWPAAGFLVFFASVALAFEGTAAHATATRGRLLVAASAPVIPGLIVLLALTAYFGPVGFWFRLWTSSAFRIAFLTIVLATILWTAYVMFISRNDGWHGRLGGWMAAAGAGLLSLTALLPDLTDVLRSLNRPLNLAPATDTMLFALQTYVGVDTRMSPASWGIGACLLVGGYLLSLGPMTRANRTRELLQGKLNALPAETSRNRFNDPP